MRVVRAVWLHLVFVSRACYSELSGEGFPAGELCVSRPLGRLNVLPTWATLGVCSFFSCLFRSPSRAYLLGKLFAG